MKYFPCTAPLLLLGILLSCSSCISLTRPYKEIFSYQIVYDPPEVKGLPFPNVVVRIVAFSVAPSFDKQKIVYSTGANQLSVYEYHTWVTNPGEMLSDLLIRDLIASGNYQAVVDLKSSINPHYEVEGVLERIYEKTEGDIWWASLRLRALIFYYDKGKHVLLQRVYEKESKIVEHMPAGIVEAMGEAAKATSLSLQQDINAAIATHESEKESKRTD